MHNETPTLDLHSPVGAPRDGHPCLDHVVTFSFGRRAKDNRPSARTLTFGDLIQEFSTPDTSRGRLTAAEYHALDKNVPEQKKIRDQEKDGAYFIACHFIGDGRRCNDNVEELCGMALDFDSGKTTEEDIRRLLSGCAYVAYTSYSHRVELEKWRVFLPYRGLITKEQHAGVYQHFQKLFLGDIDPRCETASQLWYTPACPPDGASVFQSFHALGELFDPEACQEEAAPSDAHTPDGGGGVALANDSEKLRRLEDALRFVSSDERKMWVDFGIAIKHDLGDAGLPLWLDWSRKSEKFDLDEALKTWRSFKDTSTGPSITLGSIFYRARELGWTDEAAPDELPEHIAQINECYFLAPQGGKTHIFKEGIHPLDGRQTLQAMSLSDFKALFSNAFVDIQDAGGKRNRATVAEAWLKHAKRRQYEGVLLAPNCDVPGYYNRWRGFAVDPCQGSWDLMREHIRGILCNGDDRVFEYLLSWLAFCVQHPERPAEVAVVMHGGRGTGKGIFVRSFGRIFGQHFAHISHAKHLTGNFNAHLEDCVVLFVDEGFWAGDKQGEAVLKHLITEPTMVIERKGQDAEQLPNRLHMLIASNSAWVVPAGVDERRFLVLVVADAKKQDANYFGALTKELDDGGVEAMLFDLLQRDIRHFNHRQAPSTAGLLDQKLLSLEPHQQWYFEKLQAGTLTGFKDDWELVSKSRLHDDYVESLKKTGVSRRSTQTELGMRLRALLPKGYPRTGQSEVPIDNIPVVQGCYGFPPLDVCREHFETLVGLQGYNWKEGDLESEGKPFQPF